MGTARDRHGDALEPQEPARTPLHALAAGETVTILDGFPQPDMPAHIQPHGAVERADAALNAPARLGHHPGRSQDRVSLKIRL